MFLALVLVTLGLSRSGVAEAVFVPSELQAELLSKLAGYDRNFETRTGGEALVLLLVRPKDARSASAAAVMKAALSNLDRIGGKRHREVVVDYQGAAALANRCRADKVSVVYVTPGFDDQAEALGTVLAGVDVLTVSAVPDYVPRGVVLGFELVAGKPKLVLNLPQAKKQNVDFTADVLKLMKVYR